MWCDTKRRDRAERNRTRLSSLCLVGAIVRVCVSTAEGARFKIPSPHQQCIQMQCRHVSALDIESQPCLDFGGRLCKIVVLKSRESPGLPSRQPSSVLIVEWTTTIAKLSFPWSLRRIPLSPAFWATNDPQCCLNYNSGSFAGAVVETCVK